VTLATPNPNDIALADKLTFILARKIKLVAAPPAEVATLIERHYGPASRGMAAVDSMLQSFDADERPTWSHHPSASKTRSKRAFGPVRARVATLAESPRQAPYMTLPAGIDPTRPLGGSGVFTYVVEEGQRVLLRRPDGTMDIVVGPKRVWRGKNVFRPMQHFVAHPGDYLIVRYRDGRQEHLPGPADVWLDPRVHQEISREEALQIAAKEAVVVYSNKEGTSTVQRRVEFGPTLFTPRPGEWLHTFAWHSSEGGSRGTRKVPR